MGKTDGSVQSYATEAEIVAASELFNVDIFIQTIVNTKRKWTKYSLYDKIFAI
jgi:ATP/ADP translocase